MSTYTRIDESVKVQAGTRDGPGKARHGLLGRYHNWSNSLGGVRQ